MLQGPILVLLALEDPVTFLNFSSCCTLSCTLRKTMFLFEMFLGVVSFLAWLAYRVILDSQHTWDGTMSPRSQRGRSTPTCHAATPPPCPESRLLGAIGAQGRRPEKHKGFSTPLCPTPGNLCHARLPTLHLGLHRN